MVTRIFAGLLFLFAVAAPGHSQPSVSSGGVSDSPPVNELQIAAQVLLTVYQEFISPQDRPACIFEPSCSRYMREALSEWGVGGFFMGVDRLHRCHPLNAATSPFYERTPHRKLVDPVPLRSDDEEE